MPSVIKTVTFDAADAPALARFWAAVFGSDVDEDSTTEKAYLEAAGWAARTSGSRGFPKARRPRTGCISTSARQVRPMRRWRGWRTWAPGSSNATGATW